MSSRTECLLYMSFMTNNFIGFIHLEKNLTTFRSSKNSKNFISIKGKLSYSPSYVPLFMQKSVNWCISLWIMQWWSELWQYQDIVFRIRYDKKKSNTASTPAHNSCTLDTNISHANTGDPQLGYICCFAFEHPIGCK